ncbi:MAG: hypothetical protein Q9173_005921 [Seirophora scorigena]
MLPQTSLNPQTRCLLALLTSLHAFQTQPPYPYPTTASRSTGNICKASITSDFDFDSDSDSDSAFPGPPLTIRINATTTVHGNNNRLIMTSPTDTHQHLTKLISVAVKHVLPPNPYSQEAGLEEAAGLEVTLDAGITINGSGNVVVYRKGEAPLTGAVEVGGPRERACSDALFIIDGLGKLMERRDYQEPVDAQMAQDAKRVRR